MTGKRTGTQWMLGAAVVAAAGLYAAGPVMADVTVLSDDFSDGNRTTPAWYLYEAGTGTDSLSVAQDSKTSSDALKLTTDGSRTPRAAVANFAAVTLANSGDYISLTFDARWTGNGDDRNFGFGLYNSGGTQMNADNDSAAVTDNEMGYIVKTDVGANGGTAGQIYQSRQQFDPKTNELVGSYFPFSTNSGLDGLSPTTSSTESNVAGGSYKTFQLLITRTTDSTTGDPADLALTYTVTHNNTTTTLIDTTLSSKPLEAQTYTFDELSVGFNNHLAMTGDLYIDNVSVATNTTPVPEPASLALLALGGLTLVSRRRRRTA